MAREYEELYYAICARLPKKRFNNLIYEKAEGQEIYTSKEPFLLQKGSSLEEFKLARVSITGENEKSIILAEYLDEGIFYGKKGIQKCKTIISASRNITHTNSSGNPGYDWEAEFLNAKEAFDLSGAIIRPRYTENITIRTRKEHWVNSLDELRMELDKKVSK
jgi:hypothetical protein